MSTSKLQDIESRVKRAWHEEGVHAFDPDADGAPYFVLMPVPNVTGSLHIGHALNLLLQDAVVRYRRSRGCNVFFPPGTDHAGLMGQAAAEKHLVSTGASRMSLGKEAFQRFMYQWSKDHEELLIGQMKELGLAANWDQCWFTHDAERDRVVHETFVKLHERGYVYRDTAVVNWCPECRTCLADMELSLSETKETEHHIELTTSKNQKCTLVTLKLELLLGCVAVGVPASHPDVDALAGTEVMLPVIGRAVPVIIVPARGTEREAVFDSNLTIIAPAYNADHFDRAREHGFSVLPIYGEDGRISAAADQFGGAAVDVVRTTILAKLNASGVLRKTVPFGQGEARHNTCGTLVRPLPKRQWYIKLGAMEPAARKAVDDGRVRFNHDFWKGGHVAWLDQVSTQARIKRERWWEGACVAVAQGYSSNKDWVISRQNWWGQTIPAWDCGACGATNVAMHRPEACRSCGAADLEQDPDVLDVWFSCALWPISVTPWHDRDHFSDMSVLGHDIFYFWIASANMIALELHGKPAFIDTFTHGLICDEKGRKMSKSLGNVVPLQEILQGSGAEVTRSVVFSLMEGHNGDEWLALSPQDVARAEERVSVMLDILSGSQVDERALSLESALHSLESKLIELMDAHLVAEAYALVVSFVSREVAAVRSLRSRDLRHLLTLMHPFHPLISEHFYRERCNSAVPLLRARIGSNQAPRPEPALGANAECSLAG